MQRGKFWEIFFNKRSYVPLLFFTIRFTNIFFLSWESSLLFKIFFQSRILSRIENFLFTWEFSPELRIFSWVENFLFSWEFSPRLRVFSWIENFFYSWEFSLKLRIVSYLKILPLSGEFSPWVENFTLELRMFYLIEQWKNCMLVLWAEP